MGRPCRTRVRKHLQQQQQQQQQQQEEEEEEEEGKGETASSSKSPTLSIKQLTRFYNVSKKRFEQVESGIRVSRTGRGKAWLARVKSKDGHGMTKFMNTAQVGVLMRAGKAKKVAQHSNPYRSRSKGKRKSGHKAGYKKGQLTKQYNKAVAAVGV